MVANTSILAVTLQKNMKTGQQTEALSTIVPLKDMLLDGPVNAMPIYKGKQNKKQRFAQLQQVIANDIEKQKADERDQISFSKMYDKYRQQFEELLSNLVALLDRHLNQILLAKHLIQLPMDTSTVHTLLYRLKTRQRQLVLKNVDKIIEGSIAEPTIVERASPIVFAPKKDGCLQFCVNYEKLNAAALKAVYNPVP